MNNVMVLLFIQIFLVAKFKFKNNVSNDIIIDVWFCFPIIRSIFLIILITFLYCYRKKESQLCQLKELSDIGIDVHIDR